MDKWGDEWKVAFTALEGLFKPTVMFFGLTNSLAIMMNEILQDLINTRKVASFINDVIVGIKEVEGHKEVVEEVVKRLAGNNLYIKLKKCKWKVRKVVFLEVVIRSERIKMEEIKVKGVFDWLTLKGVKDTQRFLGLANYYW